MKSEADIFVFPRWANYLLPGVIVIGLAAGVCLPALLGLTISPHMTSVGYAPTQPIAFSHALHAGELGIDCRYCHTTVDQHSFAAIPTTQSCMSCHATIKTDSPNLELLRQAHASGEPIAWRKVHDLPDYVYFDHAAHIAKGVGCNSCHGQVDRMEVVHQAQAMSMAWCLDCHREPEKFLRPREHVTNMNWDPISITGRSQIELGEELKLQYHVQGMQYMTNCSTCHR
jgi:menaquinone reductase, multiheme cytochrome c subunit